MLTSFKKAWDSNVWLTLILIQRKFPSLFEGITCLISLDPSNTNADNYSKAWILLNLHFFKANKRKQTLATFIIQYISVQFCSHYYKIEWFFSVSSSQLNVSLAFQVTALVVIPMTWEYWVLVVGLIVGGGVLFFILAKFGEILIARTASNVEMEKSHNNKDLSNACYDNKIEISMTEISN